MQGLVLEEVSCHSFTKNKIARAQSFTQIQFPISHWKSFQEDYKNL